ncbi:SRPBCC family protein [Ramlibacter sp.]|uniref:SRPBCC family protein n=1 Tax=Ramlibacter sp. TaxID=1917967 RepID=UPI00179B88C6|nr:SRPBCC family protein [Ramlibacter sp.]MBA2674739.1 SRPBCC family protein [Ramlibacter sp.]
MDPSTDRIERKILVHAPRSRVWRALSQAEEFGHWFGVDLKGQAFAPGRRAQGRITHAGYEHLKFEIAVERVEPEALLSWRWHPYAVEQGADYTREEPTLVTFTLEEAPGGTLLTVVESGFDKVPPHRRLEAFRMNSQGWDAQMQNIQRHVASGA